jgi:hypothetical protein
MTNRIRHTVRGRRFDRASCAHGEKHRGVVLDRNASINEGDLGSPS